MYTLQQIVSTLKTKGYKINTQPDKLNIVGIRTNNPVSKNFDDYISFFYYDENGKIHGRVAPATTDPSVAWLSNPLNQSGAAILKSGQYLDAYKIGLHRGKYSALVQNKPVTVIRDSDRNSLLNYFGKIETGIFGINIHHATLNKSNVTEIGLDSAGCQVFQNIDDFNEMMRLAQISSVKYGNNFSYTLLDEIDAKKKNFLYLGIGLVLVGVGGFFLYTKLR